MGIGVSMSGTMAVENNQNQSPTDDRSTKAVGVLGVPLAYGASMAGVELGPAALRVARLKRRNQTFQFLLPLGLGPDHDEIHDHEHEGQRDEKSDAAAGRGGIAGGRGRLSLGENEVEHGKEWSGAERTLNAKARAAISNRCGHGARGG